MWMKTMQLRMLPVTLILMGIKCCTFGRKRRNCPSILFQPWFWWVDWQAWDWPTWFRKMRRLCLTMLAKPDRFVLETGDTTIPFQRFRHLVGGFNQLSCSIMFHHHWGNAGKLTHIFQGRAWTTHFRFEWLCRNLYNRIWKVLSAFSDKEHIVSCINSFSN